MPVIVNADDFGMTRQVSAAIAELLNVGAISSTTVMAGRDPAAAAVRHHRSTLRDRAGVHLQLTNGRPLTEAGSLTDPTTGQMWTHPIPESVRADDVQREWHAQIEHVAELLGGLPSHLDSHHGYHRDDRFVDIYCDLARTWGLPVRGGVSRIHEAQGVVATTRFVREWTTRELSCEELIALLERANASDDVVEVVTHPGWVDDELREATKLVDEREHEFRELLRLPALLPDGMTLTTHRALVGG